MYIFEIQYIRLYFLVCNKKNEYNFIQKFRQRIRRQNVYKAKKCWNPLEHNLRTYPLFCFVWNNIGAMYYYSIVMLIYKITSAVYSVDIRWTNTDLFVTRSKTITRWLGIRLARYNMFSLYGSVAGYNLDREGHVVQYQCIMYSSALLFERSWKSSKTHLFGMYRSTLWLCPLFMVLISCE